jgi:hypothetical protein
MFVSSGYSIPYSLLGHSIIHLSFEKYLQKMPRMQSVTLEVGFEMHVPCSSALKSMGLL